MSSHRMAWKPSPFLSLFLLICFHAAVSVSCFQLTDEILHFVPECSRECFLSFLDVNYEENPCSGGLTSLQCLCANRGASGFTIGEGLVQCIAAEKAIRFCSEEEASDEVFARAFGMCNGKPSAVPATNSVFTATLILPPSGPGIVSFPPLTTTRTDFDDGTSTSSIQSSTRPPSSEPTLETDTSEPPKTTASETTSGFATSTRTSSSAETSTTENPVPDIPAGDDSDADADGAGDNNDKNDDNTDSSLGPAQVAGISVGVASAAGLALIAIFVARYYRRQRRLPDLRSLFSKRDTWPYTEKDSSNGNPDGSGSMAGVARQIEQPLDSRSGPGSNPPAYDGAAGFYSPAIGVAVASPSDQRPGRAAETPPQRPLSRLLPAKPVYVPGGARRNSPTPSELFRDATMVSSPARRWEPSSRAPGNQRQPSPSPLTLADTIQTRQQPSPVPQPSPKKFAPGGPAAVNAVQSQQSALKPAYAPANSNPLNTNKPQPPIPASITNKLNAPPPAVLERDSAVTEFEEDGGISARSTRLSTNSKIGGGGGQVWVPPSAHPSGLTYYFSDQNGNWVLRNSQGDQQHSQPPQQQYRGTKNQDQDHIHPALRTTSSLAPAAEISRSSDLQLNSQQYPRSSSIYSPNVPRPLFSGPRRSSVNNNNAYNRRSSEDSGVTQFSAASSSGDLDPPQPPINLSPVVESSPEPAPRGMYPGSTFAGTNNYNNGGIGNGGDRRNPNNLRLAAGPPRSTRPYQPPGQPSPTLGLMNPPPGPIQDRSQGPSTASNGPSSYGRYQNPYSRAFYNQPPSTLRAVSPSPPPDDRGLLPSSAQPNDFVSPVSPLKPSFFPPPTSGPWRPPRLNPTTNPSLPQPPPAELLASSPTSSANTTTSSLLTKRLGPVRAADMTFPAVRPPSTQRRWQQREDGQPGQQNGFLSPDTPGQQPGTPTWVPRLTPTRRGDDLFLNVQ